MEGILLTLAPSFPAVPSDPFSPIVPCAKDSKNGVRLLYLLCGRHLENKDYQSTFPLELINDDLCNHCNKPILKSIILVVFMFHVYYKT